MLSGRWPSATLRSDDDQFGRDVAPGRLRVRAELVRELDELLGLRTVDAWDLDGQLDADPDAGLGGAERDVSGHRRVGGVDVLGRGAVGERPLETGGIAGGEEGLRVGLRV